MTVISCPLCKGVVGMQTEGGRVMLAHHRREVTLLDGWQGVMVIRCGKWNDSTERRCDGRIRISTRVAATV